MWQQKKGQIQLNFRGRYSVEICAPRKINTFQALYRLLFAFQSIYVIPQKCVIISGGLESTTMSLSKLKKRHIIHIGLVLFGYS